LPSVYHLVTMKGYFFTLGEYRLHQTEGDCLGSGSDHLALWWSLSSRRAPPTQFSYSGSLRETKKLPYQESCPHLHRGPPSGHTSPLITSPSLIELFLNCKSSAGREEPGTWVTRQTGKARRTGKKLIRVTQARWL
jgi:hypothetical protein